MPSASATISELGWLPIQDLLNIKRINYYKYLVSLSDNRLPKFILNELNNMYIKSASCDFNYVKHIRDIFIEYGADHMYYDHDKICLSTFKKLVSNHYINTFHDNVNKCKSLLHFNKCKESTSMSEYLKSTCGFRAIQLKFKIRTGISGMGEDLMRQKRGTGTCHCGDYESLKHLVFYCNTYNIPRNKLYTNIQSSYGNDVFNDFINNPSHYLYDLLGSHNNDLMCIFLILLQKAQNTLQCDSLCGCFSAKT